MSTRRSKQPIWNGTVTHPSAVDPVIRVTWTWVGPGGREHPAGSRTAGSLAQARRWADRWVTEGIRASTRYGMRSASPARPGMTRKAIISETRVLETVGPETVASDAAWDRTPAGRAARQREAVQDKDRLWRLFRVGVITEGEWARQMTLFLYATRHLWTPPDPAPVLGIGGGGPVGTVDCAASGLGDITSVSIHNDQGGTGFLPPGRYRVQVVRAWEDDEIGGRAEGILLDEADVRLATVAGTTGSPAREPLRPERVFFALTDFTQETRGG